MPKTTTVLSLPVLCWGLALTTCLWLPSSAWAQLPGHIPIERPGDREFILDKANLISAADQQKIRQLADKLLRDKAAPIIVVTIESMANYGGAELRIETFARLLFDQWQIGPAKVGDTTWNYGMLLLVSRGDRKARIELGAGWRHDKDDQAQHIMDDLIIPQFKAGDYSAGIVAGVEGLDKLARDLQLPTKPVPASSYWIGAALIGLSIFTVVSLIRRGNSGWAWLFWGAVFAVIGAILYQMATSRSHGSRGGYSGGSFGGGFSGGGGATGSW
ncbi:MAG: hypothetical protein JWN70_3755 [Planctomycetaceae bacterium]|nr:hypothetical protein [Planctomycetaceae bacterium]